MIFLVLTWKSYLFGAMLLLTLYTLLRHKGATDARKRRMDDHVSRPPDETFFSHGN
jgi:hypothetical protein